MPPDKSEIVGKLPVQSMDIYASGGGFHPQGLYSTLLFGPVGSIERQTTEGYIPIRTEIMHPKVFLELTKLKGIYKGIMAGTAYAVWNDELKDFVKSDIIDGRTGYSFFMDHFHDIIFSENESSIRELRIALLDKVHEKCMYRYINVIPAGLRDIETDADGRVVEDDINGLYRKLIRASNTISVYNNKSNDPVLDTVRWSLQSTFNEIYTYIESILSGKRGFLLSKWGARNIHNGTRNVITAMDSAPSKLGSPEAITVNDSACGLHQYLKGTGALSVYNIKSGPMARIINSLPNPIYVVDRKTFRPKYIEPTIFTKDNWGTEKGIENLINGFEKLEARHKPIMIDGDYAALIYRDHKYFKVFYDIDDLPNDKHKNFVTPLTWGEMFYISVYQQSKKVAGYVTRYPVLGTGSIYPSLIYLKSTVTSESLQRLDDNWKPIVNEDPAIAMPIKGAPWFESMSVHVSRTVGLAADYDGDKVSLNIVTSDEAVQEARDYLNSKEAYLDPNGGLTLGVNNHISTLVLASFSEGIKNIAA